MPWYVSDAGLCAMGGQNTSSSLLATVTAAGVANNLGSWVQMHAAAPFPVSGIRLHVGKTGLAVAASNSQTLVDIGTGPSNETPLVQDVAIGGCVAFTSLQFPMFVPVGTRIVVRIRSAVASKSTTMGMQLFGGGFGLEAGYKATTYGAVTSGSMGTVLTAPASANTVEGAWTVLSAATTSPMRWAVVGISAPNTTAATAADGLLDIGAGSSGAESTLIPDISFSVTANEELNCPRPLMFPVNVPAGVRLVARYRGTSTLTTASPTVTVTGIS